jgi:hypothetical protein
VPKAEVIPTRGVAKRRLCDTSRIALLSDFLVKGSGRRAGASPFWLWGDEHVLVCHRRRAMNIRTFCTLAAAIFALIALLQLIRIVMGWSVTLNGVDVPFWASWIAVTVAGALSFVGFRAAMRS